MAGAVIAGAGILTSGVLYSTAFYFGNGRGGNSGGWDSHLRCLVQYSKCEARRGHPAALAPAALPIVTFSEVGHGLAFT
eukprot:scaffold27204_cov101-Isochrysis_galbana.AAC.1